MRNYSRSQELRPKSGTLLNVSFAEKHRRETKRSIYVTKYKRKEKILRLIRNKSAPVLDFLKFGGTMKARLLHIFTTDKKEGAVYMPQIEKNKRKRVYTYIRVSTEMQVEGYSLDSQRDRLKKEAKHKEWKIVKEYADEGKSGHSIAGRPQFKEMLERIKSGNPDKIDYVLVYKLSRFGRNAADALASLKIMQKYGVQLYCAEEGIDSTGGPGYLMITIMAAVAEIERENILVQTMAGRHQKAREGKWNGGQAPYGYKINSDTGVLEIDEEEAKVVRLIFEKFARGGELGINGVARWLEDNGYRKKLRGNGKYTLFSAHTVKTIIDNPVYVGKIAYGRRHIERVTDDDEEVEKIRRLKNDEYGLYDGKHEAIIDEALWEEAQEKRRSTSIQHEKTHSLDHEHILSGICMAL